MPGQAEEGGGLAARRLTTTPPGAALAPITVGELLLMTTNPGTGLVAVVHANRILACSAAARAEGVRRGQRRREAQGLCPELTVVGADPARDQRFFDPLLARLEELAPGVQQIRPGLVALRARGPATFYGGELAAATRLLAAMGALGIADVRAGIADGVFAAEQAAYAAQAPAGGCPSVPVVVPPGGSAAFLAPLPVDRLGDADLAQLLPQLGIRTLGEFATLDRAHVRDRFGERGVHLHAIAGGQDNRPVTGRPAPADLGGGIDFEPPLTRADQVAFSVRRTAEAFIAALARAHLVCTELSVAITGERGEVAERVWLHPTAFDSAAVVDRVRWQLEAAAGTAITSPVTRVRFTPVAVDAAAHHEPGLFGTGSDERVHHALSRVQALLGHDSVFTATTGGGRSITERAVLVPWGDRVLTPQPRDRPWPGHLPAPLPAVVFPVPRPVGVLAATGAAVGVDERGNLTAPPLVLDDEFGRHRLTAWAGPWPVDERTWDPGRHRRAYRFQAVDAAQAAWLLVLDDGGSWWAEGRYD
jgi:protein ImuB